MIELEKDIKKHLEERGWDNLRPSDLAKSVAIESGELLELFQWENKTLEEIKKDKLKLREISKELADVIIYALDMSVLLGFNTEEIIRLKLSHIEKKYPAKLMKRLQGEPGSAAQEEYWRIKKQYRKKGK